MRAAETELRTYWRACVELRKLYRTQRLTARQTDEIEDNLSELEAVVMYSEWPRLRQACSVMLDDAIDFAVHTGVPA